MLIYIYLHNYERAQLQSLAPNNFMYANAILLKSDIGIAGMPQANAYRIAILKFL